MDVDKYLLICEQLGQEPDPTKMPLELSEFPEEVQVAFFMFSLLSDDWDGTSGTYMGKKWEPLDYYFNLYDIDDKKVIAEEWLLKPDFIPAQVNKVGGFENNDLQFNSRSVVVVATRLQNYNKFKEMLKKYAWQTSGEWEVDMKPEWLKLYKENNNAPLIINLI